MFRITFLIAVVFSILFTSGVYAQDAGQRTRDLVASLDKTKHKKKTKHNITVEVYVDIKNEVAVRADASEYSGTYESEGYRLTLTAGRDGAASGEGFDTLGGDSKQTNYTLRDGRIEGALLTATKVYENGDTLPLEAVFVNRTAKSGTNAENLVTNSTEFGIGWVHKNTEWSSRVFLSKR
jgi:hypothetical protein